MGDVLMDNNEVIICKGDLGQIASPNIKNFIESNQINIADFAVDQKIYIPLEYLRNTYTNNRGLFYRLTIEFGLRGFEIKTAGNTALFYTDITHFNENKIAILSVESPEMPVASIIFPSSIGSFINDSGIVNASFFSGIIVENISKVFPGIDLAFLTALSHVGVIQKNSEQLTEVYESVNDEAIKITEMFDPMHDKKIISEFHNNGINTTADLDEDSLALVLAQKGMGANKINRTFDVLRKYGLFLDGLNNDDVDTQTGFVIFPKIVVNDIEFVNKYGDLTLSLKEESLSSQIAKLYNSRKSKKVLDRVERVTSDIERYLKWVHGDPELIDIENEKARIITLFKLNDVADYVELHEEMNEEFNKELCYLYQFTLDNRLSDVTKQLKKEINANDNWPVLAGHLMDYSVKRPTLQKMGEEVGVTRERVRQVIKKISETIEELLQSYSVEEYFSLVNYQEKPLMFKDEIPAILLQLLHASESNMFLDNDEKVLFLKGREERVDELKEYLTSIQGANTVKLDEVKAKFSEFAGYRDPQTFEQQIVNWITKAYGFKYVLNQVAYKNMSRQDATYAIIVSRYGKNFSVNDIDQNFINEEYKRISGKLLFGDDIKSDSERLINNMLIRYADNNDDVIYIGSGQYRENPINKISREFSKEMLAFTTEQLEQVNSVKIHKIYKKFSEELQGLGIDSHKELYFVFKKLYSDDLEFSTGNELSVWVKDAEKTTNEMQLIELLKKNGMSMSRSDVKKTLGWADYTIDQVCYPSAYLHVSKQMVLYTDIEIPTEIKKFVIQKVQDQLSEHSGYVFPKLIQNELKGNLELITKIPDVSMMNNIDDFAFLIKIVDSRLKGPAQLLYLEENPSDLHVVSDRFGYEVFDYDDLLDFYHSVGYAEATGYMKSHKLVNNKEIVEVRRGSYIIASKLNISEDSQKQIDTYLLALLENHRYVSLSNILVDSTQLPSINSLKWTRELLVHYSQTSTVAKYLPWKLVSEKVVPMDPQIIVRNNDSANVLTDLVRDLIRDYDGNKSESAVRNFLQKQSILVGHTSTSELPDVLDSVLYVDEDRVVHIKG